MPFLRWMHRFNRPMGVPYTLVWEDRVRNYLIGWNELGLSTHEIESHFVEIIGQDNVNRVVQNYQQEFAAK